MDYLKVVAQCSEISPIHVQVYTLSTFGAISIANGRSPTKPTWPKSETLSHSHHSNSTTAYTGQTAESGPRTGYYREPQ
eukprot:13892011-Ditylum_brightwellii.AAC.1